MSIASDLRILYHLIRPNRGRNHAERMEDFYSGQAEGYDSFRERLLKGRDEMWGAIDLPRKDLVWVDLGGGTGANLDRFGGDIGSLKEIYVVDLASSLLEVARRRVDAAGWNNVKIVEGDATTFRPDQGLADVVTFSYSLTMIPGWIEAINNAWEMLRPGGRIGVVDFFVSRKHPADGHVHHGWLTRTGWPTWFASDNVFLSPDHVPYLHHRFRSRHFTENRAKLPFMPLVRVPYYTFVGEKT